MMERDEFRCICDPNDLLEPPDPTPRAVEGCPAHRARRAAQLFSARLNVDQAAEQLLVAHQRHGIEGCLCGWADLGRSHPGHQVAVLREAGLLADAPAGTSV